MYGKVKCGTRWMLPKESLIRVIWNKIPGSMWVATCDALKSLCWWPTPFNVIGTTVPFYRNQESTIWNTNNQRKWIENCDKFIGLLTFLSTNFTWMKLKKCWRTVESPTKAMCIGRLFFLADKTSKHRTTSFFLVFP